jgi:hypothetical protein
MTFSFQLLQQLDGAGIAAGRQRFHSASGVDRDRAKEIAQLIGRAGIEAAIAAVRSPRDLLEDLPSMRVVVLLKHESLHAEPVGEGIERDRLFLTGVADEHERADLLRRVFGTHMREHFGELRVAGHAFNLPHQLRQRRGVRYPRGGFESIGPVLMNELNIESANLRDLFKHFALQLTRYSPHRFT